MAMANAISDDAEHFVNCGVCFCEFDEEIRKPKFLHCAHTVCLKCLLEMRLTTGSWIICPFCRKPFYISDICILPNNSYALQMVKLKKNTSHLECQACRSTGMIEGTKKTLAVLKKRRIVQEQLDVILKSVDAVGDQVKKLKEENDIEMAELMSLIEVTPAPAKSTPTLPPSILSNNNTRFVLGPNSVFILKLFQSTTRIGEIRIRPILTFHPEFVQKLGEFCYKSPTPFSTTIKKAQAGVLVLISMSHVLFRPTFAVAHQTPRVAASKMGEVGIILKKNGGQSVGVGSNTITDWHLFMPFNTVHNQQRKIISSAGAELFGHIVDSCSSPNQAVTEMSKSKKEERRNYSMTLESH